MSQRDFSLYVQEPFPFCQDDVKRVLAVIQKIHPYVNPLIYSHYSDHYYWHCLKLYDTTITKAKEVAISLKTLHLEAAMRNGTRNSPFFALAVEITICQGDEPIPFFAEIDYKPERDR